MRPEIEVRSTTLDAHNETHRQAIGTERAGSPFLGLLAFFVDLNQEVETREEMAIFLAFRRPSHGTQRACHCPFRHDYPFRQHDHARGE